jgi:cyclic pyranopterin phosphate synthase
MSLTHLDENNNPKMVDVGDKDNTQREAKASGIISMSKEAFSMIQENRAKKGPVLQTAIIAGIMGAKKTSELIPMCHPLLITSVKCDIQEVGVNRFKVFITTKVNGKTGIEMEALTGVSVALLTIYDMIKAIDKSMIISDIQLEEKKGGKSGHYQR